MERRGAGASVTQWGEQGDEGISFCQRISMELSNLFNPLIFLLLVFRWGKLHYTTVTGQNSIEIAY